MIPLRINHEQTATCFKEEPLTKLLYFIENWSANHSSVEHKAEQPVILPVVGVGEVGNLGRVGVWVFHCAGSTFLGNNAREQATEKLPAKLNARSFSTLSYYMRYEVLKLIQSYSRMADQPLESRCCTFL